MSAPKVSIFYAHADSASNEAVREFADSLRRDGVDAEIDQFVLPPEGWVAWMDSHIRNADFLIVVCGQEYSDIVAGSAPLGVGKGVKYEYRQIQQRVYENGGTNDRVIPIGFSANDRRLAPPALSWAHFYDISDEAQYRSLVKRLFGITPSKPLLGEKPRWVTPESSAAEESIAKYAPDRFRLKDRTKTSLQRLAARSGFRIGNEVVSIERPQLESILNAATSGFPALVVGDPGTGKTGLLQRAAEILAVQSHDVIFLDAASLDLQSSHDLRTDLQITHQLDEILLNWSGDSSAYLFIDSLDSVRTGSGAGVLRELISRIATANDRWNVVASVRQYDLRYDIALQRCFNKGKTPNIPEAHQSPEFKRLGINHIYVDEFADADIDDAGQQSAALASVLTDAPESFSKLLRTPLHLSLIGDLLAITNRQTLVDVESQMDLLDLWWRQRVLDEHGDQTEEVLRSACLEMLASRSLFARRVAISHVDLALKRNLLSEYKESGEVDRYRVAFTHALLFDYAVELLILRGDPNTLIQAIERNKDAVVLILPSVRLNALHLWERRTPAKNAYWDALELICDSSVIPDVVKATMVAVSADRFKDFCDVESLLIRRSESAALAFSYFIRAMIYLAGAEGRTLVGTNSSDFVAILNFVSRHVDYFGNDAYIVLDELTDRGRLELATADQFDTIGAAARRMLGFGLNTEAGPMFVGRTIRAVVRTYSSNKAASYASLSELFKTGELDGRKAERAKFLTMEIASLVNTAPEFVADAFECLMAHEVGSDADERVDLSRSRIMGLYSSLGSDYSVSLNSLTRTLPALFDADYISGLRATAAILAREARSRMSGAFEEVRFRFAGRCVTFRSDYCQYWDDGNSYSENDAVKALDLLFVRLRAKANSKEVADLLVEAGSRITNAAFWRRLLKLAVEDPEHFAEIVHEIVATPDLLLRAELYHDAIFDYLDVGYPYLSEASKKAVECAIESLPASGAEKSAEAFAAHLRRLMLERICRTSEREASCEADTERKSVLSAASYRSRLFGLTVDEDAELLAALESAERTWMSLANVRPDVEQASRARFEATRLLELVGRAKSDKAQDRVWNLIGGLVQRVALSTLIDENATFDWVKDVAARALKSPSPRPDPQHDEQFDRNVSWGVPFARLQAYEALQLLQPRRPDDRDIIAWLIDGARDPSPVVRHQLASGLGSLDVTPEVLWKFADILMHDSNRGVLFGLIAGAGRRLGALDLDRWSNAVADIFGASTSRAVRNRDLQGQLTSHIAISGLSGNAVARDLLERLLITDYGAADDADHAAAIATAFALNSANPVQARRMARSLLLKTLSAAVSHLVLVQNEPQPPNLKRLLSPAQKVVERLYYDSGAYEPIDGSTRERALNFWEEFEAIMMEAAAFPFPATVHHVVQIASAFAYQNPGLAFHVANKAIVSGQAGDYQFDLFAIDEMVKFVRLYLASYHELIESRDNTRRELVAIVDIFARAGWPQAMALVFELRSLYR